MLKTIESQSLSQSCHCLMNNHPDEVKLNAVLATVWLIKLHILLSSDSSKRLYCFTFKKGTDMCAVFE